MEKINGRNVAPQAVLELTMEDASKMFSEGARILTAEYRVGKCERRSFVDQETKVAEESVVVTHNLEIGSDPVRVVEYIHQSFDETKFVPVPKGTRVALVFTRFVTKSGVGSFSGQLYKLTEAKRGRPA